MNRRAGLAVGGEGDSKDNVFVLVKYGIIKIKPDGTLIELRKIEGNRALDVTFYNLVIDPLVTADVDIVADAIPKSFRSILEMIPDPFGPEISNIFVVGL